MIIHTIDHLILDMSQDKKKSKLHIQRNFNILNFENKKLTRNTPSDVA